MPSTPEQWKKIADKFYQSCNFPRCCGAIDGKHIQIKRPASSGAEFFNYKGHYSIVLLALVDANYCFTYVNIGANGRAGDAGVFRDSTLSAALENDLLNFPPDHVIVGDDAFPLKPYLMKPYSYHSQHIKQKIFNYRLSRARNRVENTFGILASRFRIFLRPIEVKPETVDKIIWAACSLHNWLRKSTTRTYTPPGSVDSEDLHSGEVIPGLWRSVTDGLTSITQIGSNNYKREAEEIRDTYATYFCNEGAVEWQWRRVGLQDDFEYYPEEENVDDDLLDGTENPIL